MVQNNGTTAICAAVEQGHSNSSEIVAALLGARAEVDGLTNPHTAVLLAGAGIQAPLVMRSDLELSHAVLDELQVTLALMHMLIPSPSHSCSCS